jgi:hypothetical protein
MQGNGEFSATDIKVDTSIFPECAGPLNSGSWEFYAGTGETLVTSVAAKTGKSLALDFSGVGKNGVPCVVNLDVRKIDSKVKLCITEDPDSVCGPGIYFEKESGD